MINNNLTLTEKTNLLRQQRLQKIEDAKRIEEEQKIKNKKNNASIWEKLGDTLYDFGANLVGGASKAIEGVIDTGSALAGNVAGWFGADDFKQQMQENIAYDWTGNNILNPADKITDTSLLNEGKLGQYIEGMASGVGQLLPTVAVAFIPGVGAGLSKMMLFGSAMGNSTEQAINEGADLGTASVYGALSGGVELLSERISGKLFGAGKIDRALGFKENLGRSLFKSAKSGLGRMAQEAVGEGLEEAFAEAVNPLLKKWTYDPDAKSATFTEIWDSAVVGALTSIAFGGTVGQLPTYKNASRISRIQDQVNEYNDAVDKLYQDSTNGKLNAEERQARQDELAKRKVIIEEKISSIMQEFDKGWNITQKSRQSGKQEAIKRINASGNLKMGLNSEGKLVDIQDSINQQNESVNVVASLDKAGREVYKPVNRNEINQQAISSTLTGKENKIVYQPTNNEISPVMKESIIMMADLSKAFGHNIDYVIADKNAMTGKKGAWDRTNNVLYLREDIDSSQVIQETIVHEFTHSLEGTQAYQGMADFVKSQLRFNKKLAKEFGIENFDSDYNTLFNKYKKVMDKNLTKAEQKEYVDTELIAKYISEKLFTDKQSIQEVCKSNPTLAQKVFNWIKETFNKLTGKTKGERFAKTFLLKAKNLYSTAIQDAGVKITIDNIKSAETTQNLDKDSGVKYSYDDKKKYKNTPYSQWKSEALAWASRAKQDDYRGFYDGRGNFKVIIATGNDLVYDEFITVPENNHELVAYYKGVIDGHNETLNRDAKEVSECFKSLSNNTGFSDNNRVDVARRRTDSGVRTMDATESNGNGKRNVKESSGNLSTKIKSYIYGDGYSTENLNPDEYNLVDAKEKGLFRDLLRELNNQIKTNKSMLQSKDLRIGLFNCLQNQKNNVYSKLAEINTAYEKTVSAYNKNNAINIPQTFIQALGYNGVIDGKDGVVYDLNNKKKNLLDYSEDRAKERLDKAIRLFGETNNPAKAGWLLADGRFVDYHRDSANIFTGNILDYEDHWQIEKVFDTRRGTDAIDAFMAEGNIRLMPEAGGIELRGKPNKNQIDKLEDFINKVIDKEGITLDLRPVGTTENHKPNPVSYDSTASAKEIMQDINSYYNTGKIAKVVDGVKFSLDEDIDTMLNDWWDKLSLEDLNEMIQDELKDFDTKEEVKLSKEERRELYVKKLYEEGKLNSVVTKLVNKNPQMKEYFKDTQMNMKYNPLSMLRTKGDEYIVMFHGTPNKNFNEFSPSFIGDNGSVMGEGFYFTASLEYANDYKQRDGRVIASLLDIKKPLSRNKVTVTKDELKTFIQDVLVKHKKNYLENFNNDIDFTVDYWINHYDNDLDLIQGMHEHSVMLWEDFYSGLRDSIGYDGVIAWNKAEGTQAIVFNSNQIKDIFNRKPTKIADIRYALEEDSEGNKLTEAQAEFFRDSKVRDENGNLLVVYHGTLAKELNKFDKDMIGSRYSFDDEGFFFIDRKSIAESYSRSEFNADRQGLVIPVYILGKKPLIVNKDYLRNNGYPRDALTENDAIGFWDAFAGAILDDFHDTKSDSIVIDDGMSKMVVAFEPNQIKRIDNKNPTKSEDIRYSLIESDGKELVALHNLSEEKLRNSIALGGLPVPSIAITKAEFGHSNFGDITLVLKPDAINPADLRNKVFGADAYSKRFPKTVNKLKKGTEEALKEKFRASAELIGDDVRNLGTYIETDSIDNIVDKLASKDYVKVQYLKDKGIGFEPIYTEYKLDENLEKNSITKKIVKMLIKEFPEEVKNPGLRDYTFVTKYILPKVADMKYDHYANQPLETNNPNERKAYIALAEKFKENTTYMHCDEYLRKAEDWLKNKGKTVVAGRATEEKLREAVKGKRKDIENYLREILTEYDEGMYYRNDRDIFDRYGNRRDFEQIYNKVTLASIVNYMSGTVQNTEGWGYGVGNVRSLLAKQYKTLEDIRADKDKIISPDEMDTLKKQSQDLYFELCYEVAPGDPDAGDEIIKEISEKPYNEKSILRVLKQYDSAIEDPEVIEHIIEFLDQLKDYPTEYFEAKPQRAVMFDEVAKFIAPQTTSNDIIDFFKKKGVEIALYEYDDDDSNRRNIIKNLPGDMRFSVEDEVDNTQSNNVEYKKIEGLNVDKVPLKLQNALVEYAQRWEKNHKKFVNESIAEWEEKLIKEKSTTNIPMKLKIINERLEKLYAEQNKFKKEYQILHNSNGEWTLGDFKREGISRLSQKDGNKEINGNQETISLLEYLISHNKFYKDYSGKHSIEGYSMKVVDKNVLPYEFHQVIDENRSMGIRTFFIVGDVFYKTSDEEQALMGLCMDDRIFIKISYDHPDYIEVNKHERLHYIKIYNEEIYNNFKNKIIESLTDQEKVSLYDKYYERYEETYNLTIDDFSSKSNERVWEEILAQIYAEAEVPSNSKQINEAIGYFDNQIKESYELQNDIKFSLDDDFDISDYYIPSDDGFFNAENPKLKGQERDTEAIKYRAKLKQNKVFSREELEKVIDDAINQKQNIRLTGKRRETAIGELFKRMNTQDVYEKRKTAQDIANFIINNVFYDEIYTDTYKQQVAEFEMIDYYKGHFELNNQIKQELEYRTENGARIVNAWKEKGVNKLSDGTTKTKPGVNPHDVAQDLNDNGLMIDMDKSETEIFLDIYDRYNALDEAIKEFKAQQKELAINKLESSTMKSYRDDLIETILRAYDEKGSKTPYAKLKETYQANLQNIKSELKDVKKYANAYVNYLVSNKRAKELVKGNKHYSAGVLEDPTLKGFLKAIAQTGNIKTIKRTARARIQKLAEVYNTSKKGSLFNDILGQEQEMTEIFGVKDSVYDENIANMIEYIAQGQGELTTDEIILLTKITDGLIHLYTTYDKVFKNGKYVETEKLAKDYGEKMRVGIDVRNKSKFLKGMWRFRAMFDPHAVMRNLDGYRCEYNEELGVIEDRGFFTEMFQEITDGEVKANVAELELLKPFGDFFKSHKGIERGLTKDKIKLNGTQIKTNGVKVKTEVEMSVGEAISIYLTSLRPQSNFYDSSVILQNKDKTTSEYSFDVKQINELFGKFTEAQKQYIKLVQKFFNEDAQKLKVETDLATLGYTNIEDSGVYFPINREKSAIAKNLGDTQVILDAINTYTLSFNKDVKPGAKLPIRISNVYGIVQNHARGMGAYYGLSVPLKTFNRVFNKQIESMGKQSLKRIASSQMYDSVAYIDKLLKDIQGRQYDNTFGGKALRWMRGNYAKFQLGFNPKTILGQTSSYMMASTYLDADALSKGLVMKTNTEQMFKYAPFTRYRMQEKTIVKAQGVIDKVGTWTDTFTKGIEWMDNNVVKKLWNASQVQIEKNTGHKIGTEENLNRASKLLEKVVRETQSNSIASEKTSLARSENEVLASLTMFSSDSQKQVSRLIDGLGLLSARKQWIANGTIKANDKIAKVAKKQILRAGAGYVTATAMFVLIGIMMKHLLGKNDEDETITEEFFGDFKTQVAGLIPIYRDVYGFMNDGYELDNYAYGMINDALQGAKSMNQLTEDIVSGKQLSKSEIGMPLRRSIYSLAQLFGVPVRNVWNYGYGIINQFSPSTAYRMNSLFYDAKLTDLDKSIQSGNDAKSIAVIKEIFESKNLKIDNNYTREVLELYKEGVNVIPGEIKDSFSYNGEEITLTSSQHKQLLDAMNKVLTNFNDVVKQAEYKKLSATQKRTYLNNLYDINYILNVAKIVGLNNMKDSDIKKFLFASVLGNDLISYMAYIKTFESDKDKEGNTITNSKKSKIQNWVKRLKLTPAEKYLLMGFAGYKNINGESTVNVYLRRKGLSKDERELVLKWCGY